MLNERVLESNNVYSRFALVQWKREDGPYIVLCLDYADIVRVHREKTKDRAFQSGWKWIHKGEVEHDQS